ncbi:hypothetical protein [Lysobacter gummosus]|uniref:hypothetical protein n=1 Tax=Lysobacter gummosus TaxID=262324 RepID=UPI00362AAD8F
MSPRSPYFRGRRAAPTAGTVAPPFNETRPCARYCIRPCCSDCPARRTPTRARTGTPFAPR